MQKICIKNFFLLTLATNLVHAATSFATVSEKINAIYMKENVSSRFHDQWMIDEGTRKKLHKAYGVMRITFDQKGRPVPHGLSPVELKRWKRLYNLCMSDGCCYCDADEGSCELGTCGAHNESCTPYMGSDNQPICGRECADYAFKSILICNDLS